MRSRTNCDRVFAVILAAGAATRFGSCKQLADFSGEPLVRRATRTAAEICGNRSVLVTGHRWRDVQVASRPSPGCFVINDAYECGLGSSLALGVTAVRHTAEAVLVLLADQPLVTVGHLRMLLAGWRGDPGVIVASEYAGAAGVPALFPATCFDRLCALRGDSGAQSLLRDPGYQVRTIRFADAAMDVDTPADLVSAERNAHS